MSAPTPAAPDPQPACECVSCRAKRSYGYAIGCCPKQLSHGALCTCGTSSAAPDQAEGPRCDAKNLGINPSSATHVCGLPEGHVGWHQCGDWYDSEPCLNAWPPVGITFDPPDKTREIL